MARSSTIFALLALVAASGLVGSHADTPSLPTGDLPSTALLNNVVGGLLTGLQPLVDVPQLVNSLNLGTGSATGLAAKTPVPAPAPAPHARASKVTGRKLSQQLPTGDLPSTALLNNVVGGLLTGLQPLVDVPQLVNSLNLGTGSATGLAAKTPVPAPAPAPYARAVTGRKLSQQLPTGDLPSTALLNNVVGGLLTGLQPLVNVPQLVNSLNLGTGSATGLAAKTPVPAPAPAPAVRG